MAVETWRKIKSPDVIVQVMRLNEENVSEVAAWVGGAVQVEEIDPEHPEEKQPGLNVQTNVGAQRLSLGMYAVKHTTGTFVSSARMFETFYEPVEGMYPNQDTRTKLGFADPFDGIPRG